MENRIHDAFDSIQAQPQLIESTQQFISKKYSDRTKPERRRMFQRICMAVCMVFVLAAGFGSYSWIQMPVSYVSIDVNPSIELALNRFDCVVSMTAYNAEGEEILKSLKLKGKKYTDAIYLIVESKAMDFYLTDEFELVFTVAAADGREEELKSGVESCSSHIAHKSQSVSADLEIVSKAHDHGFSLGKYYTYLQLMQYDDSVTIDECRQMSMAQMHGLINEHEHGGEEEHDEGSGHGKLHGNKAEVNNMDENDKAEDDEEADNKADNHTDENDIGESNIEENNVEGNGSTSHHGGHHRGGKHE